MQNLRQLHTLPILGEPLQRDNKKSSWLSVDKKIESRVKKMLDLE